MPDLRSLGLTFLSGCLLLGSGSLLLGLLMRTVMFLAQGINSPLLQSASIPPVMPPRINSGTCGIFWDLHET